MRERTIFVTEADMQELTSLIDGATSRLKLDAQYLKALEAELERAEVVRPEEIPSDVVTMNSRVELKDLDSGREMVFTLVFPQHADSSRNKISILAPIGTAILGYREGDRVEWPVPGGVKRLRINTVLYQPEAARRP